jgi:hypothetical protein
MEGHSTREHFNRHILTGKKIDYEQTILLHNKLHNIIHIANEFNHSQEGAKRSLIHLSLLTGHSKKTASRRLCHHLSWPSSTWYLMVQTLSISPPQNPP